LLDDDPSRASAAITDKVANLDFDDVAAKQFAAGRKVKHRPVASSHLVVHAANWEFGFGRQANKSSDDSLNVRFQVLEAMPGMTGMRRTGRLLAGMSIFRYCLWHHYSHNVFG
jgi:hypothetical protein